MFDKKNIIRSFLKIKAISCMMGVFPKELQALTIPQLM